MIRIQKTRQRTKRAEVEIIDLPTASASAPSATDELLAAIEELLEA